MYNIQQIQGKKFAPNVSHGQKLVAALYVVTQHFPQTDPLATTIRSRSVELLSLNTGQIQEVVQHLLNLLSTGAILGLISEKNFLTISRELRTFIHSGTTLHNPIEDILGHDLIEKGHDRTIFHKDISSSYQQKDSSSQYLNQKTNTINNSKDKRQLEILSFINNKKSVAIKDIASLFPDVSEKTIQRELGVLVASGKITKRGSKRWSIYMAVS